MRAGLVVVALVACSKKEPAPVAKDAARAPVVRADAAPAPVIDAAPLDAAPAKIDPTDTVDVKWAPYALKDTVMVSTTASWPRADGTAETVSSKRDFSVWAVDAAGAPSQAYARFYEGTKDYVVLLGPDGPKLEQPASDEETQRVLAHVQSWLAPVPPVQRMFTNRTWVKGEVVTPFPEDVTALVDEIAAGLPGITATSGRLTYVDRMVDNAILRVEVELARGSATAKLRGDAQISGPQGRLVYLDLRGPVSSGGEATLRWNALWTGVTP